MNQAAHSGFETQRRCHQESKDRGTSGCNIGYVNVSAKNIWKKEKKTKVIVVKSLR